MSETQLLAQRVVATRCDNMPDPAVEATKHALLDYLGVTIAGQEEPLAQILRAQAADEGGHPHATLIGASTRASLSQASLINGSAGHAHDYDDVHMAMGGHPTVPVAPAALALAERHHSSGAELLSAIAAGIDTECIIGRLIGPSHYNAGWHNTGTLGAFGAAAAASSLTGLDAKTTALALGIAGTQAAGLKSQFGTMCKPLHAGHAAATGVQAAALAARGFSSRPDILEAAQGFADTQSTTVSRERFDIAMSQPAFSQGICFKYHAACYLTHSSIEGLLELTSRNAFAPDDIISIEIQVPRGHFTVCNIPAPATGLEAKFSLTFTAAMALAGLDTSGIDIFTDELTQDAQLMVLRNKVSVIEQTVSNPNSLVTIRTRANDEFSTCVDVFTPMSNLDKQWQKLVAKFHALADPRIGTAKANIIVDHCRHMDHMENLDPFFAALTLN